MNEHDARWRVELHDGEEAVARFPLDVLPAVGLLFEVGDARWRVTEVAVLVRNDRDLPAVASCDVELEARWSKEREVWQTLENWEPVE